MNRGCLLAMWVEVPAVQDGQPVTDIAQRHDQVNGLGCRFSRGFAPSDAHPVLVYEPDLLFDVIEARR